MKVLDKTENTLKAFVVIISKSDLHQELINKLKLLSEKMVELEGNNYFAPRPGKLAEFMTIVRESKTPYEVSFRDFD